MQAGFGDMPKYSNWLMSAHYPVFANIFMQVFVPEHAVGGGDIFSKFNNGIVCCKEDHEITCLKLFWI